MGNECKQVLRNLCSAKFLAFAPCRREYYDLFFSKLQTKKIVQLARKIFAYKTIERLRATIKYNDKLWYKC